MHSTLHSFSFAPSLFFLALPLPHLTSALICHSIYHASLCSALKITPLLGVYISELVFSLAFILSGSFCCFLAYFLCSFVIAPPTWLYSCPSQWVCTRNHTEERARGKRGSRETGKGRRGLGLRPEARSPLGASLPCFLLSALASSSSSLPRAKRETTKKSVCRPEQ